MFLHSVSDPHSLTSTIVTPSPHQVRLISVSWNHAVMAWVTAYPCVGATSAPGRCSGRSHCRLYRRRHWHQRPSSTATACEFGTAARCPEPTQPGIVPECRQRLLAARLARSCRAICTDRHQRHPACKPVPVARSRSVPPGLSLY